MSKKSKIYHRPGCRFIDQIEENSLITFYFDNGKTGELKPCKCCCTLKALYNNYKENLRTVFADLPITTEFDGEYVKVHTEWYDWRIGLKLSSQNIKLYREVWDNEEILYSNSMQENIATYKKRYFEIEESNLSDFDTIANLINCIDDLQTFWNRDKYIDKDLLEEFIKNKDDIKYKKAVYVLRMLINDEIEMFSEFTKQQVRKWILHKVNWRMCADKYWHYIDLLSNKKLRKELLDF